MDLNQLKTFVTVAETASLTRAASLLFLSQPAVSAHIKSLENEFNVKLFRRAPRGMELTAAGLSVRDEARLALEAADNFVRRARTLGELDRCTLGTVSMPTSLNLPSILSRLRQRRQNVSLTIRQNMSGHIVDGVLSGDLDAGFVVGKIEDPRLGVMLVSSVALCIVGPWAWKARLEKADWQQLSTLPWIGTPEKCSFNAIARTFFDDHNVVLKEAMVADQEKTLTEMVAAEAGISLIREDVAAVLQKNEELYIWPGGKTASQLCFLWDRKKESTAVVSALIDVVKDVWNVPA